MATMTEKINTLNARVSGIQSRLVSLSPNDILFSAMGEYIVHGCKVTQGESTNDYEVLLTGKDPADSANANPYGDDNPSRGFQYWSRASGKDGAIGLNEPVAVVDDPPATGLARYDIAYIFVGATGAGFAIASGTPDAAVKTDFDSNGLDASNYGSAAITDPTIPLGAIPVARIYVEDVYTGIQNARIADIRSFESNLPSAYVYVRYASDASGTGFSSTPDTSLDYMAVLATTTEILVPAAGDFTGLWKRITGDTGETGQGAYLYIAYASDASGTDFSLTPDTSLDYIAALATSTYLASPAVGDFAGLWRYTKGNPGDNAYVYVRYASDASGTGFSSTPDTSLDYMAVLATTTEIPSPTAPDFAGLWRYTKGDSAYVYVAYASDASGTNFSLSPDTSLDYMAVLSTSTEIPSPTAPDFSGLWKHIRGQQGNGLVLLGVLANLAALPGGASVGDAYQVSGDGLDHVYIWNGSGWDDYGELQGPIGQTGDQGPIGPIGQTGEPGQDAFVYVAYASDASGSDFSLTPDTSLDYIAVLSTDTAIPSPSAGDFTGLWRYTKGNPGDNATAGTIQMVATGSLANGDTVIIRSDGTVEVVVSTPGGVSSVGNAVTFEAAASAYIASCFDSANGKVVIAYSDGGNSNYGTAIVGTVSGASISFGTPVVFNSGNSSYISICFEAGNGKVVIAFSDLGNTRCSAIVGTVSGDSISFGANAAVEGSGVPGWTSICYDSANAKVVVSFSDPTTDGFCAVGTVSGTSISFGTPVEFLNSDVYYPECCFDVSNGKVVIVYRDQTDSSNGYAIVGTVSGTSISYGTAVAYDTNNPIDINKIIYDSVNAKVVIAYQQDASNHGMAIVGTVSGDSISFGTAVEFEAGASNHISMCFNPDAAEVLISCRDDGNSSYGTVVAGSVSGTAISFDTPVVFSSTNSAYNPLVYDTANDCAVVAYRDDSDTGLGKARVLTTATSNMTSENFLGFSAGAYSTAQTATIDTVGGITDAQTGLTIARKYYVADSGALTLTPTDVYAGISLSATSLLVKG